MFNKESHLPIFSIDSGVGAGIDSYYEYLLKAYVLLGDDSFLERFNTVSKENFLFITNLSCKNLVETQLHEWDSEK